MTPELAGIIGVLIGGLLTLVVTLFQQNRAERMERQKREWQKEDEAIALKRLVREKRLDQVEEYINEFVPKIFEMWNVVVRAEKTRNAHTVELAHNFSYNTVEESNLLIMEAIVKKFDDPELAKAVQKFQGILYECIFDLAKKRGLMPVEDYDKFRKTFDDSMKEIRSTTSVIMKRIDYLKSQNP